MANNMDKFKQAYANKMSQSYPGGNAPQMPKPKKSMQQYAPGNVAPMQPRQQYAPGGNAPQMPPMQPKQKQVVPLPNAAPKRKAKGTFFA